MEMLDSQIVGISYGLASDREVYVQFKCYAYSTSIRFKWEPANGGWEVSMEADSFGLRFIATHPMLLHVFAVQSYPTMANILESLAAFGKREDIGLGGCGAPVTEVDPECLLGIGCARSGL